MRRRQQPVSTQNGAGHKEKSSSRKKEETNEQDTLRYPAKNNYRLLITASLVALVAAFLVARTRTTRPESIFLKCVHPDAIPKDERPVCTYFNPVSFFKDREYRHVLTEPHSKHAILSSFAWQVNNWSNGGPSLENTSSWARRNPHVSSVTAIATPKSGSRTLWQLFYRHLGNTPTNTKKRVGQVSSHYMVELSKRQQQNDTDIVFAVIRDPVSRFLSSISQILRVRGSRHCHGCDAFLEPCLESNTKGTFEETVVECTLASIQQHGFWNEHLIPTANFLSHAVYGQELEVMVFTLASLDKIVSEFVGKTIHANPSGNKEFHHSLQLDKETIDEICTTYKADVAILRYLGFLSGTPCEEYGKSLKL